MAFCYTCMGRRYVICLECEGTGKKWSDYIGHGVLRDLPNICNECGGSGHVICPDCDGEGEV